MFPEHNKTCFSTGLALTDNQYNFLLLIRLDRRTYFWKKHFTDMTTQTD